MKYKIYRLFKNTLLVSTNKCEVSLDKLIIHTAAMNILSLLELINSII